MLKTKDAAVLSVLVKVKFADDCQTVLSIPPHGSADFRVLAGDVGHQHWHNVSASIARVIVAEG